MPILWKNLLTQYFKVLLLCITAFIAVLVTTRLDEIAHFATLGSEGRYILLFVFYQIPYILPIALPFSGLISSLLLVQGMSQSHELTAMRACGLALKDIFAPVLLVAFLLSIFSFFIVSELATTSHLYTALLKNELRSVNPLLMLGNKHLMKLKGIHFDTLGASKQGESASGVIIAMPNRHNNRLSLLVANEMQASSTDFIAKNVCLISNLPSEEGFDLIALENTNEMVTTVEDFSQIIQKKVWNVNNDHLRLPLLLVRLDEQRSAIRDAQDAEKPMSEIKQLQRAENRTLTEIARRFSLALAMFTFTIMGLSFGVSISRQRSCRSLLYIVGLTGLYLAAYFSAVGIGQLLIASTVLYLAPHVIIIAASGWILSRAARGIE